jgi:peroxiredoxin (alkyl hydroperoxide reductase subunit C)
MIEPGATAPDFELADHLGRKVSLAQFRGKRHVLLAFYPLDFTAT